MKFVGGVVVDGGSAVTNFAVGDVVGVGCMVDSCRSCRYCRAGDEQYCREGFVGTYSSKAKYRHCAEYNEEGGAFTQGGYSQLIVVDHNFVLRMPPGLDLAGATPLLCAGITTYSPFIHYNLRPSSRLAVVGLGGLGHMVRFFVNFKF